MRWTKATSPPEVTISLEVPWQILKITDPLSETSITTCQVRRKGETYRIGRLLLEPRRLVYLFVARIERRVAHHKVKHLVDFHQTCIAANDPFLSVYLRSLVRTDHPCLCAQHNALAESTGVVGSIDYVLARIFQTCPVDVSRKRNSTRGSTLRPGRGRLPMRRCQCPALDGISEWFVPELLQKCAVLVACTRAARGSAQSMHSESGRSRKRERSVSTASMRRLRDWPDSLFGICSAISQAHDQRDALDIARLRPAGRGMLTIGHRFEAENVACTPKYSSSKVSARHLCITRSEERISFAARSWHRSLAVV